MVVGHRRIEVRCWAGRGDEMADWQTLKSKRQARIGSCEVQLRSRGSAECVHVVSSPLGRRLLIDDF